MTEKYLSQQKVTLAVINAKIWTANPLKSRAEAISVSGNLITTVDSNKEVRKLLNKNTLVIDAKGQILIPGFTDSHLHFIEGGLRIKSVQLRDARTPEDFIARIKAFAETIKPGTWITGGDWNHELWGGELPCREWIDKVTPNNPIWINRLDGHMALANSIALKAANITKDTPDIKGGTIVRSSNGEPTGIFKDNAMKLITRIIPEPSEEMKDKALKSAMQYVARQGVTSIHNMGTWNELKIFERLHKEGKLRTRISAAVPLETWEQLYDKINSEGNGDQWLRIGALKTFMDGSLGSHTAAFFQPYADAPNDTGLLLAQPEELYHLVSHADKAGLQVITHAIGDRAVNILLNIYERVASENGPRDRRFRIEHAQHIVLSDIPRFNKSGIIASMQPYQAINDGQWAEKVIGSDRLKTSFAFRSLLDAKTHIIFGSDWYVEPPIPLDGIYAAVTRQTLDGKNPDGWIPEQKISVEEALKCYTINPAYATFEEKLKGSLEQGKLADFVIIGSDLTNIPPEEIRKARVMMTVVDGKVVYER